MKSTLQSNAMMILAFIAAFISGCSHSQEVATTDISLDKGTASLYKGETIQLQASVTPAQDGNISWESSDSEVATVSGNGLVTAISPGSAVITASFNEASAQCIVTVNNTTITLNEESLSIRKGDSFQLEATVNPPGSHDITWSSTNTEIASVDKDGLVTGIAPGETSVLATYDGVSAECHITVEKTAVESITLDCSEANVKVGFTYQLKATCAPEDAEEVTIQWESDDNSIVSVNENGLITGEAPGETTVRAFVGEVSAECKVTVHKTIVGAYYYSDGTYSKEYDDSKTAVGLIYWEGDPTQHDPTLKKEHPECTHGLVMALNGYDDVTWMNASEHERYKENYPEYSGLISTWQEENLIGYMSILSGLGLEDNINKTVGYNNTKVLEAFNDAPENAETPINVINLLREYVNAVPLPEETSGWYVPSPKEISLYARGDYAGNITEVNSATGNNEQGRLLNEILENTPNATPLPPDIADFFPTHWSSSERANSYNSKMPATSNAYYGSCGCSPCTRTACLRMIFAF